MYVVGDANRNAADNLFVTASFYGDVIFPFENANIRLRKVFHLPQMGYSLVPIDIREGSNNISRAGHTRVLLLP